ncbi:MAG: hypothetical protein GTO02_22375 [Candidatus Dadabacteria bacterium]|nr:hypothetical protein [Candidatus Dadabacteria bacterium]
MKKNLRKVFCNYCLENKEFESHNGVMICNDCWVKELVKFKPEIVKIKYLTYFDDSDCTECIDELQGEKTCGECKKVKSVYYNADSDGTLLCLMCLKDGCGGFDFRPINKKGNIIFVDLKKLNINAHLYKEPIPDQVKPEIQIHESQWVRARDYQ